MKFNEIIHSVLAHSQVTKRLHNKSPDLFICNREILDVLKAGFVNVNSPVTIKYTNSVGYRVYVFGIPFYESEDFILEPFVISTSAPVNYNPMDQV